MFSGPEQLSSLHHAIDVLERLAGWPSETRLGDLARTLKMSKPGVYRILATLKARGYVERSGRGAYRLGLRAWELGCSAPQMRLVTVAAPFMERLTRQTHESSILGVLVAFEVVYLHRIDAGQAVRVHTDVGTRIPAHCTSTGLAILAQLPLEQLEADLPSALPPFTPLTITDRARLRQELQRVARRGYAVNVGGWREDVAGVAAPIFAADGAVLAAVNVSLPRARFTRRRMRELGGVTQEAAADISRALRFAGGSRGGSNVTQAAGGRA